MLKLKSQTSVRNFYDEKTFKLNSFYTRLSFGVNGLLDHKLHLRSGMGRKIFILMRHPQQISWKALLLTNMLERTQVLLCTEYIKFCQKLRLIMLIKIRRAVFGL